MLTLCDSAIFKLSKNWVFPLILFLDLSSYMQQTLSVYRTESFGVAK